MFQTHLPVTWTPANERWLKAQTSSTDVYKVQRQGRGAEQRPWACEESSSSDGFLKYAPLAAPGTDEGFTGNSESSVSFSTRDVWRQGVSHQPLPLGGESDFLIFSKLVRTLVHKMGLVQSFPLKKKKRRVERLEFLNTSTSMKNQLTVEKIAQRFWEIGIQNCASCVPSIVVMTQVSQQRCPHKGV